MLISYIKRGVLATTMLLIGIVSMRAQVKYEGEQSVNQNEVPSAAIDWLCSGFDNIKRLKWYEQFSTGQRSYEAKFKREGYRYSVEFDTLGKILDVEIQVRSVELDPEVRLAIEQYFDKNYDNWRLRKIQRQFTGTSSAWEEFRANQETENLLLNYEIEYYGKKGDAKELWEALFDQDGNFNSKRQVQAKSADNLNY